jgi:hypothetical protein
MLKSHEEEIPGRAGSLEGGTACVIIADGRIENPFRLPWAALERSFMNYWNQMNIFNTESKHTSSLRQAAVVIVRGRAPSCGIKSTFLTWLAPPGMAWPTWDMQTPGGHCHL